MRASQNWYGLLSSLDSESGWEGYIGIHRSTLCCHPVYCIYLELESMIGSSPLLLQSPETYKNKILASKHSLTFCLCREMYENLTKFHNFSPMKIFCFYTLTICCIKSDIFLVVWT